MFTEYASSSDREGNYMQSVMATAEVMTKMFF